MGKIIYLENKHKPIIMKLEEQEEKQVYFILEAKPYTHWRGAKLVILDREIKTHYNQLTEEEYNKYETNKNQQEYEKIEFMIKTGIY